MAILKANAYGHGLEAVARCLAPQADAFGVALVEEGIALRRLGIENPILVMGGIWTRQIPLFLEHRLTFTVPSLARLRDIEEAAAAHGAARGPPQDRHRDGADRRPPLQRRGAPRGRRALAPRRGRGHLHALRERRRGGPRPRAAAARALPGGAALLRAPLAARARPPRRELGRAPADAGGAPRHGAPRHPPLRRLSLPRRAAHGRGEAGPLVAVAGRLLQGRGGGQPRLLRLDLAERPPGAPRDRARGLRRRLLPQHVEPGRGRAPRRAPSAGRAASAWTR